jgi:surface protein
MFDGCSKLTEIKALENWNVSNGEDFSGYLKNVLQ